MLDILLATYNSEKYLREQLDSILQQDFRDYTLFIRDGGSRDSTLKILEEYQDPRIRFIGSAPASALKNFSALLEHSTAPLTMFSDHDDVWMPDKITRTLAKYQPTDIPTMIFTDAVLTNSALRPIAASSLRYQHLDPTRLTLRQQLLQNVPFGNTMLINRALRELAMPIPPQAVMHDHWLSLTAAVFGQIIFLPETTLFYRQHGKNVSGARRIPAVSGWAERFNARVVQAGVFLEQFREKLSPDDRLLLEEFSRLPEKGFLERRRIILRHRIYKSGFLRNLAMMLTL